jgi:hypothetical protein
VGKMTLTAYNQTGSTIPQGAVVYITGSHGNDPQITLAIADTEAHSAFSIGIAQSSVANNTNGTFVTAGTLESFDTHAWSDGTPLYLSPTVAGGLTSTKPTAPNHYTKIGTVIRSHPTQGTFFVKIENGFQLDEMSDVSIPSLTNNDVLTYESSSALWKNKSIATILGYTPANGTNYLAKADNLSGLASTSTARTNLGLTSIATSSFATTAESEAMTSTTAVLSPARFRDGYFTANITKPNTSTWLTGTLGTGGLNDSGTWDFRRLEGPTSAANTYVRCDHGTNFGRGRTYNSNLDWSKYNAFQFRITQYGGTDSNSIFRAVLGEPSGTNTGDPTVRSVGIRFNGTGAIKILAHNGTTLTTYTTSYSLTVSSATDILVVSDGSGTVTVYADGVSIGSTTGGPTTLLAGTASQSAICYRIENNSTPTATQVKTIIAGTTAFTS